ncbi:MAG TPA: response regulator transcription factor [Planctomycetaceae bacterium]|nr:response regulator transcription factor [Planctomycetaceae bacterium]
MNATLPVTAGEPTVYVVDDDPALRKALRWLMESIGLRVLTFASAQEFLSAYSSDQCGCMVLDVRMPGMSGLELQERLREQGCDLPMIVMTAFGDVPMAVRSMKAGAVHFFEKPVSDQVLLDQVQTALAADVRRRQEAAQHRDAAERYARLTAREAEVLEQVVAGLSSKEIGNRLGVSFKTVEAHRAKIMRKMDAESVPHLIRLYLDLPKEIRKPIAPSSDEIPVWSGH